MESLKPSYISGLTILGGEPMELLNQKAIAPLIDRVKKEVLHASIWIYSGYTWEELNDPDNAKCHGEYTDAILSQIDILVDGEFVEEKKDIALSFRGSSNQRIIDVPKSLQEKKVILWDQKGNI